MKSTYLSREAVYETFLWQPRWTEWFVSRWHCSLLSNSLEISWAVWMVIATVVTLVFSSVDETRGYCPAQCRRALSVLLTITLSCESLRQNPWDRRLRRRCSWFQIFAAGPFPSGRMQYHILTVHGRGTALVTAVRKQREAGRRRQTNSHFTGHS